MRSYARLLCVGVLTAVSLVTSAPGFVSAAQTAPLYRTVNGLPSAPIIQSIEPGDDAEAIAAKTACSHPAFPLVCVKAGHSATLSIVENCYSNGVPVSCGDVTWSATTSHPGIGASFNPVTGNPSLETITATLKVKPGKHYYQLISAVCTAVPNCPLNYMAQIIVLKK